MSERLQKFLARAGIASRRAAERLIVEGRVSVNGLVTTVLGTRVDPGRDAIRVDGRRIPRAPAHRTYLVLHKPRGFVTTLRDPEGRPTVRDLLPPLKARVFPVGRLDFDSEGLLLLTDDGDLAKDLMHPTSGVPKTYLAKVRGCPDREALDRLRRGVGLEGGRTLPARVHVARRSAGTTWVEVTVVEGRNRQVRRMLEAVGHPVQRLRRVAYGGLRLGRLPSGRIRALDHAEVALLRELVATRPRASGPGAGEDRS